jgi:hypothetical protein
MAIMKLDATRRGCRGGSWWILLLAMCCTGGVGQVVATPAVMSQASAGLLTGNPEERARIEQALPSRATVQPQKPRRLLIFDLNVNYGGHASIPYANYAFVRMGEKTGAYETVISRDPEVFRPETLRQFDAVFFNNTVGNLFEDADLRQSLVEFVHAGGDCLGCMAPRLPSPAGRGDARTSWSSGE